MVSQKLTAKDETFVTGGTEKVSKNADKEFLKTGGCFRCNCERFEARKNCGHVDICDSCEHSVKSDASSLSTEIYCSKQNVV